jgi:Gamma-glutamyl cyclotransferase, AIG2-like
MTDMPSVRLFSYGTLRQAGVQRALFGRLLEGREDVLPGYRLGRLQITDPGSEARVYPIAEQCPGEEVVGVVFELTEPERAAADAYETSDYIRISLRLTSGLETWVYVRG